MHMPITTQQVEFVIAHINDRPRTSVARKAGISMSSLYRIVREHGGIIDHALSMPSLSRRDTIAANYPYMSANELSERFGIPKSSVIRWAEKLNLRHTSATMRRLLDKRSEALAKGRTPQSCRAAAEKMRRHRKMERFRILSGQPQQTSLNVSILSKPAARAATRLCREFNYFRDKRVGGQFTLYYDAQTRRTPFESVYTQRYRFLFKET